MSSPPKNASGSATGFQSFRRACDRCHAQKLKCLERSETNRAKGCQRCYRARLECVYGQRTRFGRAEKRSVPRPAPNSVTTVCTASTDELKAGTSSTSPQTNDVDPLVRNFEFDAPTSCPEGQFSVIHPPLHNLTIVQSSGQDYGHYVPPLSAFDTSRTIGQEISDLSPLDFTIDVPSFPDFDISGSGSSYGPPFHFVGSNFAEKHQEPYVFTFEDNRHLLDMAHSNPPMAERETTSVVTLPVTEHQRSYMHHEEQSPECVLQLSTLMKDLQMMKDGETLNQPLHRDLLGSLTGNSIESVFVGAQIFSKILQSLLMPLKPAPIVPTPTMTYPRTQRPSFHFTERTPSINSRAFFTIDDNLADYTDQHMLYASLRDHDVSSSSTSMSSPDSAKSSENSHLYRTGSNGSKLDRSDLRTNPRATDQHFNYLNTPMTTPSVPDATQSCRIDTATSLAVLACYLLIVQIHSLLFDRIFQNLLQIQGDMSSCPDLSTLQCLYSTTHQIHSISQRSIILLEKIESLLCLPDHLRSTSRSSPQPPPVLQQQQHSAKMTHEPPCKRPRTISNGAFQQAVKADELRDGGAGVGGAIPFPMAIFEVVIQQELLGAASLQQNGCEAVSLRQKIRRVRKLLRRNMAL